MTIQIERTVHGPVVGRTMAIDPATGQQIPVAVSYQRSTWFDELGSAPAFLDWNDPDFIHGAKDFLRAGAKETRERTLVRHLWAFPRRLPTE